MLTAPNHLLLHMARNMLQDFPRDQARLTSLEFPLQSTFLSFWKMGATFAFIRSLGTSPDLSDFTEVTDVSPCKCIGQFTAPSGALHVVPLAYG